MSHTVGVVYLGFIAQLCFELFKCLNNLDKQIVNCIDYVKVLNATQTCEKFRTSVGGPLKV